MRSQITKVLVMGMVPPPVGGMATFISDMLNAKFNENIKIQHFDTTKKTSQNRLLFTAILYHFFLILKLILTIVIGRPKIIHIHICSFFSFYRSSIDIIMAKLLLRKIIVHIHGGYFDQFYNSSNQLGKYYIKSILNAANVVIVLSEYWEDFFSHVLNKNKITIVKNGVNISDYKKIGRKRLGNSQNKSKYCENINLLYIGGVSKNKGIMDLIVAVLKLKNKSLKFNMNLVGPEIEDGVLEQIENFCKINKLFEIINIKGTLIGKEKNEVYKDATIFILPSYAEGLPITIIEAMACGLPIISSKVGGIPEVIKENINGFLIDPGDVDMLTERIEFLIKNKNIREDMGKNNLAEAISNYDFKIVVEKLERIYENLLSSNSH